MLNSQEIIDLVGGPPTRMTAGRAAYHAQREGRRPTGTTSAAQLQFLGDLSARPSVAHAQPAHPGARPVRRKAGPLTPSEIAWLSRLPADPAKVPFEDARVLAGLAADVPRLTHPGDARLVESVWAPVRAVHDSRAVDAAILAAGQPLPATPASARPALADAIRAETPALSVDEALGRAGAALADAEQTRRDSQARALSEANAARDTIVAAEQHRAAVHPA